MTLQRYNIQMIQNVRSRHIYERVGKQVVGLMIEERRLGRTVTRDACSIPLTRQKLNPFHNCTHGHLS